jgi:hypothetical protein
MRTSSITEVIMSENQHWVDRNIRLILEELRASIEEEVHAGRLTHDELSRAVSRRAELSPDVLDSLHHLGDAAHPVDPGAARTLRRLTRSR